MLPKKAVPATTSRRRLLTLTGLTATGLVAGCLGDSDDDADDGGPSDDGGDDQSDDSDDSDDGLELPDTLRIGHPSPARPSYFVPFYTVLRERLAEHDMDVEPVTYDSITAVIAGMIQGEVDFAPGTPTSMVSAIGQGFPIRSIAEINQQESQVVVSQDHIEDWEDLRGETVVGHAPDSFSTLVLKVAVERFLGSQDEVEYSFVPGTPNRLAGLEAGEILATAVTSDGAMNAERAGIGKIFYNPNDDFENMSLAQIAVLEDMMEDDPEFYQFLVDETVEAFREMYDRDATELAEAALEFDVGFSNYEEAVEIWAEAIQMALDDELWPTDPAEMLTDEKVQRALQLSVETDLIDEAIPTEDIVDRRFLD